MAQQRSRLEELFGPGKKVFSIYATAGFPKLDDTVPILAALADAGVDMIELGMPFSDPIADGPTIQAANMQALKNGVTLKKIFSQIEEFRTIHRVPLLLMGHTNPVLQFGIEEFVKRCKEVGVDGVILPDLSPFEYETRYRQLFEENNLPLIFLITSETSEERIRHFDELSRGFLYLVSSPGVTGNSLAMSEDRREYFARLRQMNLNNGLVVGFGINSPERVAEVQECADGTIIGSEFVRAVEACGGNREEIKNFVHRMKGQIT